MFRTQKVRESVWTQVLCTGIHMLDQTVRDPNPCLTLIFEWALIFYSKHLKVCFDESIPCKVTFPRR